MGVFRVHKSENFTVMSNYHLKDRGLSLKAQGLLSLILSLPNDWDYSVNGLVSIVKDGKSAVQSALVELEDRNYLIRRKVKNDKGQIIDWEYLIFEDPRENNISDEDKKVRVVSPPSENQDMGNQDMGNQDMGNQSQLNTKEPNTKEPNTNQKSTGAGALSKNHSQVYKKRESLNDDLESGEIIDEQKKEKKKASEYDKCLVELDKRYSDPNLYMILANHLEWSYNSKDPKRIRTLAIYKRRLDELDKLNGDKIAIVQQSINRQWHCFYELQESKSRLSNKREELSDVIKVTTQEEVQNNIAMLRESGKELF